MSERELAEEDRRFVIRCLEAQFRNEMLLPQDHNYLLCLMDAGFVGMDGFKYCWPETARDNWRRCH